MPLAINEQVSIDEAELTFTASRSGGPGGQHVNKVSTRVTLLFDVEACSGLSAEQKALIRARLATRIGRDGVLRVVCRRFRSQLANRRGAVERFVELLRAALARKPARAPTRPTTAGRERRLAEKRRRGAVKRDRAAKPTDNEL